MVSINYSSREVCCKIVYYGPGLSGKTTNLQYVHSKVPSNTRGKLISLATESDRTLYFDFLPINIGTINGFAAKFQLYTVPGQVYYNATRKLVLRGVDGVVFVADSQPDKMEENIESLVNLEENLKEYGYNINDLPMVIQYNKRDLPGVLTVEELNAKLNTRGWPHFESSATIGNGVFDTLKLIIKLVLDKAKSSSTPKPAVEATPHPTPVAASAPAPSAVPEAPSVPQLGAQPNPEKPQTVAVSASSASAAASVEKPSADLTEAAASQGSAAREPSYQYRPYPGTEKEEDEGKRISPTTFSPARREEATGVPIERRVLKPDSADKDEASERTRTPVMAPALRRRGAMKRRGFWKRLFGIK